MPSPRAPSESVATSDCAGTRVSLLAAVGETPSSACGTHGPTPAPGSISKEAAIAAARKALPGGDGDTIVAWASIEHDPFLEDADRDSRLVWEVRLEGAIAAASCPSGYLDRFALRSDPPCLDIESGIIVVLDPSTGAFLGWLH